MFANLNFFWTRFVNPRDQFNLDPVYSEEQVTFKTVFTSSTMYEVKQKCMEFLFSECLPWGGS
jgi:hypothetical protein